MEQEALKLVSDLNFESAANNENFEHITLFEFKSIGFACAIEFMGVCIWTDDNDEREYVGDTDERESLRDFIIRQSLIIFGDVSARLLKSAMKKGGKEDE